MKITEYKLKMLIKEELENMQQEGLLDVFASTKQKPKKGAASKPKEELENPKEQEALVQSYELLRKFVESYPKEGGDLSDVERFEAMQQLLRDLSSEMIWKLE